MSRAGMCHGASKVALTDANLQCSSTWTPSPAGNETRPVVCENWYEAYAFCIWDGGFLPSEAEWNYAASGGSEQRVYPWSNPATSPDIDCSYANYAGDEASVFCVGDTNQVGSESPKGDGRYGQADLAGNAFEWVLDRVNGPYAVPCDDCSYQGMIGTLMPLRSSSFATTAEGSLSSYRNFYNPSMRGYFSGVRCARMP